MLHPCVTMDHGDSRPFFDATEERSANGSALLCLWNCTTDRPSWRATQKNPGTFELALQRLHLAINQREISVMQMSTLAWDIAHVPADIAPMQCVFLLQHMSHYFIKMGVDKLDGNQIARVMWAMARRTPMSAGSSLGERAVFDLIVFLMEHILDNTSKLSVPFTFSYSLARMVWAVARIYHRNEEFLCVISRLLDTVQ